MGSFQVHIGAGIVVLNGMTPVELHKVVSKLERHALQDLVDFWFCDLASAAVLGMPPNTPPWLEALDLGSQFLIRRVVPKDPSSNVHAKNATRKERESQSGPTPKLQLLSFPYIVIRWMAAAYETRQVTFSPYATSSDESVIHIRTSEPVDLSKPLSGHLRQTLVNHVKTLVQESGLRMCIILSKNEALYVESDGSVTLSSEPPKGGIQIDQMPISPKSPGGKLQ